MAKNESARFGPLSRAARSAPLLDPNRERTLAMAAKAGDVQARDRLIVAHLRLVIAAAQPYVGGGVSLEDLVSEGCLGLMEAAKRFDPERGNRFSTYAVWWVRAHLRRYALANRRIVPTPSTRAARKVLGSLQRARKEISQNSGQPASREELAERIGVKVSDLALVEQALGGRDVVLGPTEDGTSRELPTPQDSPEELTAEAEFCEQRSAWVESAMHCLTARERVIIERRLLSDERCSLASLGEHFGVSRERVRQIQERARAKLRTALRTAPLNQVA